MGAPSFETMDSIPLTKNWSVGLKLQRRFTLIQMYNLQSLFAKTHKDCNEKHF